MRAREVLGSGVTLGVDYHHRLSVAETISFCHRMPRGTLDFLEEPIRDEIPEAYETLRRSVDVPFAIGEEFASKWQALPYVERGLAQYMRLDICNIGGFTESLKVAGWCEAHYVDLMPHNPLGPVCTAASIISGPSRQISRGWSTTAPSSGPLRLSRPNSFRTRRRWTEHPSS